MAPTAMKAQTRNPTRAVPAMPGTDRGSRAWTAPVALAVVHLLLALAAFDPTPHTGGDNAAYVASPARCRARPLRRSGPGPPPPYPPGSRRSSPSPCSSVETVGGPQALIVATAAIASYLY